jgi:hypothetical protein
VPWEPPRRRFIRADAKIIHLERDPLFTGIPGWGFPADLPITGCSEISLPALTSIVEGVEKVILGYIFSGNGVALATHTPQRRSSLLDGAIQALRR